MSNPLNTVPNHKPLAKSTAGEIFTEIARRLEVSTDGTGPSQTDFARIWNCRPEDLQHKAADWLSLTAEQLGLALEADEQARPDRGRAFVKPKKGR